MYKSFIISALHLLRFWPVIIRRCVIQSTILATRLHHDGVCPIAERYRIEHRFVNTQAYI